MRKTIRFHVAGLIIAGTVGMWMAESAVAGFCYGDPCSPGCPDECSEQCNPYHCNPRCGGNPSNCPLETCSTDPDASCCPCTADSSHPLDVSVTPDVTWVGDVIRLDVCSDGIAWPGCYDLWVWGAEFTTQDADCPLRCSDWIPYPLADTLYTPPPNGSCELPPWGEGGQVYLPNRYTFYLAPYYAGPGSVMLQNVEASRGFDTLSLDLALPNRYSPPTAFPEHTPWEDQQPGYYWGVNDNFDEGKCTEDREDPCPVWLPKLPGQPPILMTHDMLPVYLDLLGSFDPSCGGDDRLKVYLRPSVSDKVRLFAIDPNYFLGYVACQDTSCSNCCEEITPSHNLFPGYLYSGSRWDWEFYLEGTSPGELFIQAEGIIDGTRRRIDEVLVKIVQIDVDVDSDNTNTTAPFGPDAADPMTEDRIEDRDDLPGRIVLVNDDDDDNDGVVDYGDGFNLNPDDFIPEDNQNQSEDDFIEMKLRVPAPVDLTAARIRVTYEASNPDSAAYDYGDPPEVPPISITPAAGLLRVWTKSGSQQRLLGTCDYVAPDTHPASDFGLSNGTREVSLWLEGISPGQTRVVFELDPDGDAGPADFVHSDAFRVTVLKVGIVNPTAPIWVYSFDVGQKTPRIMTPANAPLFSGNEFTYSDAYPDGVLTLPVYVVVEPNTQQIQALFESKIRARVSAIDDSHSSHENVQLVWDHPFPGEPTAGNVVSVAPTLPLWRATATFTKLPPDNEDFGLKTLTVDFLGATGNIVCSPRTRDYEIFYPIEATNHPDLPGIDDSGNFSATIIDTAGHGNSTRSQNWFFYWNRTPAGDAHARFYSDFAAWMPNTIACVPAGTHWSTYMGSQERTLFDPSGPRDHDIRMDGSNKPISGIDNFANTVLHEKRHVLQKLEHDALNPYDVSLNGARVGYSWCANGTTYLERTRVNIQNGLYNHFWAGPDMSPGWADHDDDNDQEWDELDEFIAGPGDTVVGNDEDLDPDDDFVSHLVPTDPDPYPTIGDGELTEKQAEARETSPQDTFREYDWGSPGKQHGPDLATPNDRLEMNRYDD